MEDAATHGHVGGLRLKDDSELLDPMRHRVHVLIRRDRKRESSALDSLQSLGSVILTDQEQHVSSFQRCSSQLPFALIFPVDNEPQYILVPSQAPLEILDGQRS